MAVRKSGVVPQPEAAFARAMARLFPDPPAELGIAVSGGSDSTALLFLTANWAANKTCTLYALTIDHGLRPEAAAEAEKVARQCAALGVTHATLRWIGWDGQGNLQDAARRARHGLIERWRGGVGDVLMGHTMDDQAETVLMRLARGSGVEGLSGIAERAWVAPPEAEVRIADADGLAPPQVEARAPGFTVHRPLLEFRRQDLRNWLRSLGMTWSDDPSNDKTEFDRVRARRLLQSGTAGLTVEGLAATAGRMARARAALGKRAQSAAQAIAKVEGDAVRLRRIGLLALDPDTRLRLTAQALVWVASADYRPREAALTKALEAAMEGTTVTLHGCLLLALEDDVLICREPQAVAGLVEPALRGARWDRRWHLIYAPEPGLEIRALGEAGLAQLPDLPPTVPPRQARLAAPGLWRGDALKAAPTLGHGPPDCLCLAPPRGEFTASLVAH